MNAQVKTLDMYTVYSVGSCSCRLAENRIRLEKAIFLDLKERHLELTITSRASLGSCFPSSTLWCSSSCTHLVGTLPLVVLSQKPDNL